MLGPNTLIHNRYRIVRYITQGGMGAVYEAIDLHLDTSVALKQTLRTGQFDKMFQREARLLARLRHPALPRVSNHFIDNDGQFLVMEFIPGDDLGTVLAERRKPFPLRDILQWLDQLLDALHYLHTQHPAIIHRDIKPQNLKLLSPHQIILLDFGLAKGKVTSLESSDGTSPGGFTPQYAPLEQFQGSIADPRSDLYALAATTYRLLSSVHPENALTRATAVLNHQSDPLRPVHQLNPEIPTSLSTLLMQAMALQADDRPASAVLFRQALHACWNDTIVLTEADDRLHPLGETRRLLDETTLGNDADSNQDSPPTRIGRMPGPPLPSGQLSNSAVSSSPQPEASAAPQSAPTGHMWRWHRLIMVGIIMLLAGWGAISNLSVRSSSQTLTAIADTAANITSSEPTLQPPPPTPSLTAVPASPVPSATPTLATSHWATVARVRATWGNFCVFGPSAVPNTINVKQDSVQAAEEIYRAFFDDRKITRQIDRWPVIGGSEQGVQPELFLMITNIGQVQNERLQLSSTFDISIQASQDITDSLVAVQGNAECGSAQLIRQFPSLGLSMNPAEFDRRIMPDSASSSTFYTLAPGDIEGYLIPFHCNDLGSYTVSINIPYIYIDETGTIPVTSPSTIVCPQSFALHTIYTHDKRWMGDHPQHYTWDHEVYKKTDSR